MKVWLFIIALAVAGYVWAGGVTGVPGGSVSTTSVGPVPVNGIANDAVIQSLTDMVRPAKLDPANFTHYYVSPGAGGHAATGNNANPGTDPKAPRQTLPDFDGESLVRYWIHLDNDAEWVSDGTAVLTTGTGSQDGCSNHCALAAELDGCPQDEFCVVLDNWTGDPDERVVISDENSTFASTLNHLIGTGNTDSTRAWMLIRNLDINSDFGDAIGAEDDTGIVTMNTILRQGGAVDNAQCVTTHDNGLVVLVNGECHAVNEGWRSDNAGYDEIVSVGFDWFKIVTDADSSRERPLLSPANNVTNGSTWLFVNSRVEWLTKPGTANHHQYGLEYNDEAGDVRATFLNSVFVGWENDNGGGTRSEAIRWENEGTGSADAVFNLLATSFWDNEVDIKVLTEATGSGEVDFNATNSLSDEGAPGTATNVQSIWVDDSGTPACDGRRVRFNFTNWYYDSDETGTALFRICGDIVNVSPTEALSAWTTAGGNAADFVFTDPVDIGGSSTDEDWRIGIAPYTDLASNGGDVFASTTVATATADNPPNTADTLIWTILTGAPITTWAITDKHAGAETP